MRYTFFCWWISSKQDLYLVFLLNNSLSKTFTVFFVFCQSIELCRHNQSNFPFAFACYFNSHSIFQTCIQKMINETRWLYLNMTNQFFLFFHIFLFCFYFVYPNSKLIILLCFRSVIRICHKCFSSIRSPNTFIYMVTSYNTLKLNSVIHFKVAFLSSSCHILLVDRNE